MYTSYVRPVATRIVVRHVSSEKDWSITLGGEAGVELVAEQEAHRRRRMSCRQRETTGGVPFKIARGPQTLKYGPHVNFDSYYGP